MKNILLIALIILGMVGCKSKSGHILDIANDDGFVRVKLIDGGQILKAVPREDDIAIYSRFDTITVMKSYNKDNYWTISQLPFNKDTIITISDERGASRTWDVRRVIIQPPNNSTEL